MGTALYGSAGWFAFFHTFSFSGYLIWELPTTVKMRSSTINGLRECQGIPFFSGRVRVNSCKHRFVVLVVI